MNGQFTLQQAEQLLNFEAKLDVGLLDAVVHCFYDSLGEEVGAEMHCVGVQRLPATCGHTRSHYRRCSSTRPLICFAKRKVTPCPGSCMLEG